MTQRLADGALTVVSTSLPADRTASWIMGGLTGSLAVNCYVLHDGDDALIVDTGLAAHWQDVRAGLDDALAAAATRSLIMTRREPDAIGNLPAIVERYRPKAVYCGGVISPLDFFERVDVASAAHGLRALAGADVTWVHPASGVTVGTRNIEVLETTLRVLPKNHLYDPHSRTLFASDTWAFLTQASAGPVQLVREPDDSLSSAVIADDLLHRFEWLAGIDTTPMQDEIAGLLARRAIDRICSSYGCIVEGPAVVDSLLQNTILALQDLSRRPPIQRSASFRADRVRALLQPIA